jgi:transposase
MARKKRRAYATDLTDTQWALISPLILEAEPGGRPRKAATRELVNAILYFLRAGMAWRLLPHDLPPWQTVYYYLRRQREGVWDRVHHSLVMADREQAGRDPNPTAAILDSQSIKTGGSKGYDAGKKIKGRKRHILTDTDANRHGRAASLYRGARGLTSRTEMKPNSC